jgi:soluble cytochrome b562
MPKLDGTHIADRLEDRLAKLKSGEEVAARDMKSLLSAKQTAAMDAAWAKQQVLRKQKRARNKAEEVALGWKSKRDIHIEALTQALHAAQEGELAAWKKKAYDADVRQGRVYFDELKAETAKGVDAATARIRANNALTRSKLKRLDGAMIGTQGLNKRDREIRDLEDAIQQKSESELDDYEREQLELKREHEKAVLENRKKRGK